MFQMVEQAKNSNSNPMELLKQVTKGYNDEQINGLFEKAKQFGIPEDVIKQAQNEIKTK